MLSENQCRVLVEKANPGVKAVASAAYKNLYLVRVEFPDPDEKNYDPFFSVDPSSGAVKEFSIMTDGDPVEVAQCFNS